jgi:amidohydrolase
MRASLLPLALVALSLAPASQSGSPNPLAPEVDRLVAELEPKVVAWRRDFHQHPELGLNEVRTARVIAEVLVELGYEVTTGIAGTGVVGVLRGGKPGPVVALRADMDALPVTEEGDLPFKSSARTQWNGQEVGVMHACGHDNHMAIQLGVASVLARLRERVPGTVKLLFQPAEEGPGGAAPMIAASVLEKPNVDAIFGLHVFPFPTGTVAYRPGPLMASADNFVIRIQGRQTHGAVPWGGVDPIVVGAQLVLALQTIVSRNVDITAAPAVVTIGRFTAGNRPNIVPDMAELEGTVRTFDESVRQSIHERIRTLAKHQAEGAGASATVEFGLGYPATVNDPALTERMLPTLRRVVGAERVQLAQLTGTAEDFSYFQQKVPGLYLFLGVTPAGVDPRQAAMNHSPRFFADEAALPIGVRLMANLALDFLHGQS